MEIRETKVHDFSESAVLPGASDLRYHWTERWGFKLVCLLWFLFLFEPARFVSFYIPILRPLKWLPEILLYFTLLIWFASPRSKHSYPWFTIFMAVNLFGTVIAFFFGNWGIARAINRQMLQYYVLGVMTLTFLDEDDRIERLFQMYFLYFLYFAVWGILSLKLSPVQAAADPGGRIIVPWHHHFENRDGFGSLMGIGLGYCYYYGTTVTNGKGRFASLCGVGLTAIGIIVSFARASFGGMILTFGYMWVNARRKLLGFTIAVIVAITVLIGTLGTPFGEKYWQTMNTIVTEGTAGGTGADRKVLWGWAWRVFLDNPVFGAGTGNVGIAFADLIPLEEAYVHGYTEGKLWGRSIHCAPLTLLGEYGVVGSVLFLFLIMDFIKTNRRNKYMAAHFVEKACQEDTQISGSEQARKYHGYSMALMASFIAYILNSCFYEIIYLPFLWNLIVLNRLLNVRLCSM